MSPAFALVDTGLLVDADGRIVELASEALMLLGLKDGSEMLGRPLVELFHRTDAARLQSALEHEGTVLLSAIRNSMNSEIEVCVSVGARTGDDHRAILIRPLDRLCPVRGSIRSLENEQKRLFENLQVGVVIQGPSAEMLTWNAKALELLGLSEEQLTGRTSFDPRWNVIHPDGSDFPGPTHPVPVAIATKSPVRGVVMGVFRPTTGDRVWLTVDADPRLNSSGDIEDVVCTFTDITVQQQLAEEFANAQKFEVVSRMAGSFAHDFNNMLAVIMAVGDMRMFVAESEDERSALRDILDAAQRGSQLTRKLLSMSGGALGQTQRLWVDAHLAELGKLFEQAVGEGVDLQLELNAPGACLTVDPSRLEQAILNLAINARDAMPEGGSVSVHTRASEGAGGATLTIEVRDTGTGIPPEIAEKVFEPFYTTKGADRGTGLGLASVREFATSLHGTVYFETSEAGTTFFLQLPCVLQAPSPDERPRSKSESFHPDLARRRLLLVDNAPDIRAAVSGLLRRAGYDVMVAANGEDALKVLDSNAVDLLVTDVIMQKMDGVTLAAQARKSQPRLPVVFVSGYIGTDGTAPPPRSSLDEFLAKPFSATDLYASISRLLASSDS